MKFCSKITKVFVLMVLNSALAEENSTDPLNKIPDFLTDENFRFQESAEGQEFCSSSSGWINSKKSALYKKLEEILGNPAQIGKFYKESLQYLEKIKIDEDIDLEDIESISQICCLILRAPVYKFEVEDLSRDWHERPNLDIYTKNISTNCLDEIIHHLIKNEKGDNVNKLLDYYCLQLISYNKSLRQIYHKELTVSNQFRDRYGASLEKLVSPPIELVLKYLPEDLLREGFPIDQHAADMTVSLIRGYRNNIIGQSQRTYEIGDAIKLEAQQALGSCLKHLYPNDAKKIIASIRAAGYPTDQDVADFLNRTIGYNDSTKFLFKGGVWKAYKNTNMKEEFSIFSNNRL